MMLEVTTPRDLHHGITLPIATQLFEVNQRAADLPGLCGDYSSSAALGHSKIPPSSNELRLSLFWTLLLPGLLLMA